MNVLTRTIVLLVVTALTMTGCSRPTETPSAAASEAYKAMLNGNTDTVWQSMSQADRSKFMTGVGVIDEDEAKLTLAKSFSDKAYHRITVGDAQVKGNTATVAVTAFKTEEDADGETRTIELIREDGRWVFDGN